MGRRENTKRRNAKRRIKIIRGGTSVDSQDTQPESASAAAPSMTKDERRQAKIKQREEKLAAQRKLIERLEQQEAFSKSPLKPLGEMLEPILKYIIMNTNESVSTYTTQEVHENATNVVSKYFS